MSEEADDQDALSDLVRLFCERLAPYWVDDWPSDVPFPLVKPPSDNP